MKLVIVALLLLNLGTLGYLWIGARQEHHEPHRPPEPGHGGPARFLREALQLTDQQESAYRKQRETHHEQVLQIREQMRESKRQLYALMQGSDSSGTATAARQWLDSLAAQQRRIELITFEHFKDVRGLCTPPQQKKFDEVIGEALEQMH